MNALWLALRFTDETQIPTRFKKDSKSKGNSDSKIEQNFQQNIERWQQTVGKIMSNVERRLAWRFINNEPEIEKGIPNAAFSKDFIAINQYLIERRQAADCGEEEVGHLALMLTDFQRKIDRWLAVPVFVQ